MMYLSPDGKSEQESSRRAEVGRVSCPTERLIPFQVRCDGGKVRVAINSAAVDSRRPLDRSDALRPSVGCDLDYALRL
jgi:hypothetical protein